MVDDVSMPPPRPTQNSQTQNPSAQDPDRCIDALVATGALVPGGDCIPLQSPSGIGSFWEGF